MIKASKTILKLGAKNVLLKGGHRKSKKVEDVYLGEYGF